MKNGLKRLCFLLRQISVYETLYLCTIQFFWRSSKKCIFLTLILHFCPSLCSNGHRKHSHSVFVLTISSTKICLWGGGNVIEGMLCFTPTKRLFLWVEMSHSSHHAQVHTHWGKQKEDRPWIFYQRFPLCVVSPSSTLKKLVQKKCESGNVGSLLSVRFLPSGKAWLITMIWHTYI